jgi:hypothetical protein
MNSDATTNVNFVYLINLVYVPSRQPIKKPRRFWQGFFFRNVNQNIGNKPKAFHTDNF